jgi:23S rRNA pseudouridine955/2504/2580 synthase
MPNQETEIYHKLIKSVIYEDKHILVLNKPINLAVQGGNKIKYSIDKIINLHSEQNNIKYRLTHRLDKDSSGILILAKTDKSAKKITELFAKRKILKSYLTIVTNVPKTRQGEINHPIIKKRRNGGKEVMQVSKENKEAKEASTYYKVIDNLGKKTAFLLVKPLTGRKHQIRIHLSAIGSPILGDGKYGGKAAFINNLSNKIHLHAYHIEIENYFGKKLNLTAPLSGHFKETCDFLSFNPLIKLAKK